VHAIARGIRSLCLSVWLSITFRYQTNEDTIVLFSASGLGYDNPSNFCRGKVYPDIRWGSIIPSEGVKVKHLSIDSKNLTNNRLYLGNGGR